VSEVAAIHAEANESPLTPESWGKLGMWVFLVGDAMSFGTLLAGYGGVRYGSIDWPVPAARLGINLTAFMTFLLIVSFSLYEPRTILMMPPAGTTAAA